MTAAESQKNVGAMYRDCPIPTYIWEKHGDDFILIDFNKASLRLPEGLIRKQLGATADALIPFHTDLVEDISSAYLKRKTIKSEVTWRDALSGGNRRVRCTNVFVPPDNVVVHVEEMETSGGPGLGVIADYSPNAILLVNADGVVVSANAQVEKMFGYRKQEVIGQMVEFLLPERLRNTHAQLRSEYTKAPRMRPMGVGLKLSASRKDGTEFPVEVSLSPVPHHGETFILAIVQDITDRKQTEDRLKASLQEKELLLKEVHHRVKNNLQIISSLLGMQVRYSAGKSDIHGIRETQSRIRMFALLHERLYLTEDLTRIDMAGYLRALVNELLQFCGRSNVSVDVQVRDVLVSMDQAIPCGLIVNELVSNALKHGFPNDSTGQVEVILQRLRDSHLELVVRDNGIGIPESVSIEHPATLGLELVKGTVTQAGGEIELRRNGGTEFRIRCIVRG